MLAIRKFPDRESRSWRPSSNVGRIQVRDAPLPVALEGHRTDGSCCQKSCGCIACCFPLPRREIIVAQIVVGYRTGASPRDYSTMPHQTSSKPTYHSCAASAKTCMPIRNWGSRRKGRAASSPHCWRRPVFAFIAAWASTGVVGTLQCGDGKRTIGLRADMDALAMPETGGTPLQVEISRQDACLRP